VMDEVFGQVNFVNEIVWKRRGGALNNFGSSPIMVGNLAPDSIRVEL